MYPSYLHPRSSPFTSLEEWPKNPQDGLFKLVSNNKVVWHFAIFNERLHYATHSLQTLQSIEFYLQKLGYEDAIAPSQHIVQTQGLIQGSGEGAFPHDWNATFIQQLESKGILSQYQANRLIDELSRESVEMALWEPSGSIQQISSTIDPKSLLLSWNGLSFSALLQVLQKRQKTWQSISDAIQSPYQRPYCTDISRIREPVSGGALPAATLEVLAKLMKGRSMRELAQILKQDELKFSQLLYPYVKRGIVSVQAPVTPFHRLPLVSSPTLSSPPVSPVSTTQPNPYTSYSSTLKPTPTLTQNIETPPPDQRDNLSSAKKKYKIVCIDDNASMLEMLEHYLEDECFDVTTVANPMQSIPALFAAHPDLVLMDVSMPGINGNRLCQILKRSSAFKTTPIIMVSGNTGVLDKTKAKAMGATDYLPKPFSKETLLDLISHYLGLSLSR